MTTITTLEFAVLRAIDNSEYGDFITDQVWMFSVTDNLDRDIVPDITSFPGIVSSLKKKRLVGSCEYRGEDPGIWMTDAGVETYAAACAAAGMNPRKKAEGVAA